MKENENNELEKLADKAMKSLPLETPSFDFTSRVMAQVAMAPEKTIPAYKPLLPKTFWIVLITIIIGLFGYAYFTDGSEQQIFNIDFDMAYANKLQNMANQLDSSKTTMYAAVALLLAMLVQIPLIRNRFQGK